MTFRLLYLTNAVVNPAGDRLALSQLVGVEGVGEVDEDHDDWLRGNG